MEINKCIFQVNKNKILCDQQNYNTRNTEAVFRLKRNDPNGKL